MFTARKKGQSRGKYLLMYIWLSVSRTDEWWGSLICVTISIIPYWEYGADIWVIVYDRMSVEKAMPGRCYGSIWKIAGGGAWKRSW